MAVVIIRFPSQPRTPGGLLATYRNVFTDDPDYESPDQLLVNMGMAVAIPAATKAQQQSKDGVQFGEKTPGAVKAKGDIDVYRK